MKLFKVSQLILLIIVIICLGVQEGEAQDSSCLTKLIPCVNYLDGTKDVPDSCCKPLKSLIQSQPKCLCSLISNKSTSRAKQAGINVTAAQDLPLNCGLRVNPLLCLSGSPTSSKTSEQSSEAGFSLLPIQSLLMVLVACVINVSVLILI